MEKSKGDLTAQAVDYKAKGKITLESEEGRINLLHAMNVDYQAVKKSSSDGLWDCNSQSSRLDESVQLCHFVSDEDQGIQFITPEGITVELPVEKHKHTDGNGKKPKTRESTRLKDLSGIEGYEWLKLLDAREDVVRVYVDERHETSEARHQGMTAAAKIVLSLIITVLTMNPGTLFGMGGGAAAGGAAASGAAASGAAIGSAAVGTAATTATTVSMTAQMATAAISAVKVATLSHFSVGAIDQRGRMDRVSKSFVSKDNLKSLATTVLAAAITAGISNQMDIKTSNMKGFTEQLKGNAVKGVANFAANAAVYGDVGKAAQNAGIQIGVDTVVGTITNDIGEGRKLELDAGDTFGQYILHKVKHAFVGLGKGAATAALQGKKGKEISSAGLGGAVGGVAAEVIGEAMREDIAKRVLTRALEADGAIDMKQLQQEEQDRVRALAQAAAVATATVCGVDFYAASDAAQNAIDNNAIVAAIPYAVAGACAVWSACDIYNTYREEGVDAALQKAGVEVATMVVAGAVIKRGYKLAGIIYPSAEAAWTAYLVQNPKVAAVAEYCVDKSGKVKDIIIDSKVGKFMAAIDNAVEAKFKSWFSKESTVGMSTEAERFWTKRIEFKGNKVYQRDDLFDPHFVDEKSLTNLQRMAAGRAPIGVDGKSIELHHMLQTNEGAIAELTQTFHQQYKGVIHINTNDIPSGINRIKFDYWRQKYWKQRAKDFE